MSREEDFSFHVDNLLLSPATNSFPRDDAELMFARRSPGIGMAHSLPILLSASYSNLKGLYRLRKSDHFW
ncbi:MAG TPA: hypothetical protein VGC87_16995 [Pyrinomonadaceae bacterium]|jgi:hypothetical protein